MIYLDFDMFYQDETFSSFLLFDVLNKNLVVHRCLSNFLQLKVFYRGDVLQAFHTLNFFFLSLDFMCKNLVLTTYLDLSEQVWLKYDELLP